MAKRNYAHPATYHAEQLLRLNQGLYVIPLTSYGTPPKKFIGYNSPEVAIGSLADLESRTNPSDWDHGLGLVLHLSNMVMLDIDMHKPNEQDGWLSYDWLLMMYSSVDCETVPDEMTTWTYSTPNNGQHLLFTRPEDFPPLTRFKRGNIAPGIELMAHGVTPVPPTKRKRAKGVGEYEWLWVELYESHIGEDYDSRFILPYEQIQEFRLSPEWMYAAPLPEWLTEFAYNYKQPLMSQRHYNEQARRWWR